MATEQNQHAFMPPAGLLRTAQRIQHLGRVGQQLGVQACARERAAQFVADGQQQGALGLQHLLDVVAHGVDGGGQFTQFVVSPSGR